MKLLLLLVVLCPILSLASSGTPSTMAIRDTSSTNLHVSYAAGTSTLLSNLQGTSHLLVYNGTSSAIAVSPRANSCGSSTTDAFMIPATSGLVLDNVAIAKAVCVRSLSGSSVTSGVIYSTAW